MGRTWGPPVVRERYSYSTHGHLRSVRFCLCVGDDGRARQCPAQVGGLVLLAPSFGLPRRLLDLANDQHRLTGGSSGGGDGGSDGVVLPSSYCDDIRLGAAMLQDIRTCGHASEDAGARLARDIACPTLIAHGDADDAVPWGESHEFFEQLDARRCGRKDFVLCDGADHRLSEDIGAILEKASSMIGG